MNDSKPAAATPAPRPPVPADSHHVPSPVDLTEESVAGEEDPGAALDEDIVVPPITPRKGGG
jgi:hypothetical protein